MKYPYQILNKRKFILSFINALVVNLSIYLLPLALAIFTTAPFTLVKFMYLILSVIVLKLTEVALNHVWVMYVLRYEYKYGKDLQIAYFNRIAKMKPFQLNKLHNGFLKKQIDIIADEAQQFIEYVYETVNGFAIAISIFLIQVFHQDVTMFYICIVLIIAMVIYNLWLGKRCTIVQETYNQKLSKYNGTYVDFLQNIKSVKRLYATKYATKKNEEAFKEVIPELNKANFFYSLRSNGINFFVYFMYVMILVNLYFKMKNGQDVLPYLVFYASIFNGLTLELKDLARLFLHHNKFQAATNQVEKMIGETQEEAFIKDWKEIQIQNVNFKYNNENKEAISIPQFILNRKDKISIIGKSGQGKTTFLNILARYIEISSENYKIDGLLKEGNLDLAYISQETELFDLTIRENLCLGKEIKEEVLMRYLREAGLDVWVQGLEHGLDTVVGEKGLKLSVGQKQRMNIIRGILLEKDVYILDEPTSNLDKETEKMIVRLIEKYLEEKTVIIVTHREELKKICNKHYIFTNNTLQKEEMILI